MATEPRILGILRPMGGGDPIPLYKEEMTVGRRRKNDICLDFDNVSGKHCTLRMENGVWHVRDLDSTNGTTINGSRISGERGIMPDDEVGIASHIFHIDYEPSSSIMATKALLGEELAEPRQRRSLLELAGLESETDSKSGRSRRVAPREAPRGERMDTVVDEPSPTRSPSVAQEPEPADPSLVSDEDYYKLFQDEVDRDRP